MPETTPPVPNGPDALTRAHRTHVVVVGGGIAGLVAALEWAKVGARVTVLEASDRFGGAVETVELGGVAVDLVVDAFPRAAPALHALLDELRLGELVESARPHAVWIAGLPGNDAAGGTGGAAPLPAESILGIPANTWAGDVRRIIGWAGAWRAYVDRLRPPLTIGHERSLGVLVRTRMGDRVVDRLVAPVTQGLYGLNPDDVDVEVAAPGLSSALTRTGSLAGAASDLLPAPDAAPTRATLRGGMGVLIAALVARLSDLGADLRLGNPVGALRRAPAGAGHVRWHVELSPLPDSAGEAEAHDADLVIVATGARNAAALLAGVGAGMAAAGEIAGAAPARDVVTLVVESRALDAAPRGRAVYPVEASTRQHGDADASSAPRPGALSVAQASADWAWLAAASAATGAGTHVLRVALPADQYRSDARTISLARDGAEALLGVQIGAPRAAARRTVELAPPASALGHAQRTSDVRGALPTGVIVVGGWVAGSGLAQVVADATAEVDRSRSAVLWGETGGTGEVAGVDR